MLIPPHTSHISQAFDVGLASPLKTYFNEFLVGEKFDEYIDHGVLDLKKTAKELRRSMLLEFTNALHKCTTLKNIQSAFKKCGIYPLDAHQPLNSQYALRRVDWHPDDLMRNYWINGPDGMRDLFRKKNNREITLEDFNINIHEIVHNLKSSSIEEGKPLSKLPPLFEESLDSITKLTL